MITRRNFIRNSALAGLGFPLMTGLFPNPSTNSFSCNWKDIKMNRGFFFAGLFETPIQEGEKVKDLVQQPTSYVYKKEWQVDGCVIYSTSEIFVVNDGRYCRVTGLEEIAREDSL